ncbi:methionyl-tRNA formyltransferase [Pleionea sediminis]|uniref:methionyl-tRNA formyltransferase n=1 Tax=Pleionea sediminis TaxID=2569479 RepID=UPI001184FFC9|nr:methionyl-tRNA formyltransferase [Pleionea sediminis]
MKVGYFADGPWSHEAIKLFTGNESIELSFIVPRFDTQDPVLKQWAEKLKIPFIPHPNVNSKEFLQQVAEFEADLFVSMSFNQILKRDIIDMPRLGFINCHAGALPFYRGRNPLNWVLINGESSFGITAHYIDEGIDTGDIIEQRLYPITETDNYGSLLEKAISECAHVLAAAIEKIQSGKRKGTKQETIHPVGTYYGRRSVGDELIDFRWSARRFCNFVRAISNPGPNARCFINEQEYAIIEASMIEQAPEYISTIGEVVGKDSSGVVVKVGDSTVLLAKMARVIDNELKEEFVPSFRIGTRMQVSS